MKQFYQVSVQFASLVMKKLLFYPLIRRIFEIFVDMVTKVLEPLNSY